MSFDEDLGKHEEKEKDNKVKNKKNKKRKNVEESGQLQENDRKKSRKELMKKTREEVIAMCSRTWLLNVCFRFIIARILALYRLLLIIRLLLLPQMLRNREGCSQRHFLLFLRLIFAY